MIERTRAHDHDHAHDLGLANDLGMIQALSRPGLSNSRLSRRHALRFLGGSGVLLLAACGSKSTASPAAATPSTAAAGTAAPPTTDSGPAGGPPPGGQGGPPPGGGGGGGTQPADGTIPQETAGPYPGDGTNGPDALTQTGIVRSDITTSLGSGTVATGVPLTVKLKLTKGVNGAAMSGAAVYIWHCDQQGRYSMYSPGVTNETYLRGVQEADSNGEVQFTTIFPAAYSGRWPHIHYEVYSSLVDATDASKKVSTSQLAMTSESSAAVFATAGYEASVANFAATSLATDMVFSDGADLETPTFSGDATAGYVATLTVPIAV
jgi:protocatechuate 3,4-dioxygenase beta subunit